LDWGPMFRKIDNRGFHIATQVIPQRLQRSLRVATGTCSL
jgi:hypothetical protein